MSCDHGSDDSLKEDGTRHGGDSVYLRTLHFVCQQEVELPRDLCISNEIMHYIK